jgi:golgi phosphoprotein 3
MSSSGLTRRRGGGGGAGTATPESENGNGINRSNSSNNVNPVRDSAPETSYESGENGHKIAFDPRDISESAERSKQPKLTLMEEIILLGLKDKQVHYPFICNLSLFFFFFLPSITTDISEGHVLVKPYY